jgi:D-alanine-D-alanine ligase-like ATP-grasp enzyme
MGDRALDVIEIVAAVRFYDYEAKYAPGGSRGTFCRRKFHHLFTKRSED